MRPLALVLGTAWLVASTGCYSWMATPPGRTSAGGPVDLRLTMLDGTRMQLFHAQVVGDSIIGRAFDGRGFQTAASVPAAHVRSTEYHVISAGKTIGFVLGSAAGIGLIAAIAVGMHDLSNPTYLPPLVF